MLGVGADFELEVLDVIHASEYDGLKSGILSTRQVFFSKQSKKFKKRFIIACLIDFVYH